jgi:hypothetical protein
MVNVTLSSYDTMKYYCCCTSWSSVSTPRGSMSLYLGLSLVSRVGLMYVQDESHGTKGSDQHTLASE